MSLIKRVSGTRRILRRSLLLLYLMDFTFYDPGLLIDGDLRLHLISTLVDATDEGPLPTYRFDMQNANSHLTMGGINLRIGRGANFLLYRGHIGYAVEEAHRGHHYAARSCSLLLPLARRYSLNPLWITCDPDNVASRKTCEWIGAEFVEIVDVREGTGAYKAGARRKCRYRLIL